MDEFKVIDIVRRALNERRAPMMDSIVGGACKDFAEYRYLCGVIQGLNTAERELLDLANTMKEAHDN